MFRLIGLLFIITILLSGCKSDDKIVPVDVWSVGCGALRPDNGGYKLSGLCCEYLEMDGFKLRRGDDFTINGTYHSYTGAGFSNEPVKIRVQVSDDGKQLTLSLTVNNNLMKYDLVPGPAVMACYCYCD